MDEIRWEQLLCATALQAQDELRVGFVIVLGESSVCDGQGNTSSLVKIFDFFQWQYAAGQS